MNNKQPRIAHVTVRTPFGRGEEFILPEMRELSYSGWKVFVFPISGGKEISVDGLDGNVSTRIAIPRYHPAVFRLALRFFISNPLDSLRAVVSIALLDCGAKVFFKNLTIVPRMLAAALVFKVAGIQHIHAHWGTRTASLAMGVSRATGIPWSFTLHRWDIYENNLLAKKVRAATFVRCISSKGKADTTRIARLEVGEVDKVRLMHLGVESLDHDIPGARVGGAGLRIGVPASLREVKGHRFLLQALGMFKRGEARDFRCHLYGDGPMLKELRKVAIEEAIGPEVVFEGSIERRQLLAIYRARAIDVVVLPSITTADGQFEGIPVSLMEAMMHGVPVISTRTGSISELVVDGAGILVDEKDPQAIKNALVRVSVGGEEIEQMIRFAREIVRARFEIGETCRQLTAEFQKHL